MDTMTAASWDRGLCKRPRRNRLCRSLHPIEEAGGQVGFQVGYPREAREDHAERGQQEQGAVLVVGKGASAQQVCHQGLQLLERILLLARQQQRGKAVLSQTVR